MIYLRILKLEGVRKFEEYIYNLRNEPQTPRPNLNSEQYSSEFQPRVQIDENKTFATRMEMAKYLSECFNNAKVPRKYLVSSGKENLWTWLAYICFDQITDNSKKVQRTERYICSSDWNRYYVHLVAGAYYLFSSLGEDKTKLFLCSPPYTLNDFNDHMACYQYIVGYPNIVDVAHILYWDCEKNTPKRGAQSKKNPGNIRRFSKIVNQIELTYDVYSMKPEKISQLLPSEFDKWKLVRVV